MFTRFLLKFHYILYIYIYIFWEIHSKTMLQFTLELHSKQFLFLHLDKSFYLQVLWHSYFSRRSSNKSSPTPNSQNTLLHRAPLLPGWVASVFAATHTPVAAGVTKPAKIRGTHARNAKGFYTTPCRSIGNRFTRLGWILLCLGQRLLFVCVRTDCLLAWWWLVHVGPVCVKKPNRKCPAGVEAWMDGSTDGYTDGRKFDCTLIWTFYMDSGEG